jgi:hypothetical protein
MLGRLEMLADRLCTGRRSAGDDRRTAREDLMHGQTRSRANSREWNQNFEAVDWSDEKPTKPGRGVKSKRGGGFDCGIKSHEHDTFAEALTCVQEG